MRRTSSTRFLRALAIGAGCGSALGGAIPAVSVTASNGQGTATWSLPLPDNVPSFNWRTDENIELRDPTNNNLIGVIDSIGIGLQGLPPDRGNPSPQVSLNFAVQAGNLNTDFTIASTLVSFTTINSPLGRANAGFSVSDLTGDGVRLEGRSPGNTSYLAQYNGFVPGGSTFASGLGLLESLAPGGSDVEQMNFPDPVNYAPIGTPVSDISAQIAFNLTALDLASGTSNYQLIPEPSSLLLISVAALALRRR